MLISHRNAIPKHPLAVLSYATRHGYSDILDEAAEETIGVDAYEVTAKLSPAYLLAWVSDSSKQSSGCDKAILLRISTDTIRAGSMRCNVHTLLLKDRYHPIMVERPGGNVTIGQLFLQP